MTRTTQQRVRTEDVESRNTKLVSPSTSCPHHGSTTALPYPPAVLQSLTLGPYTESTPKLSPRIHVIPARHGHAFRLKQGQTFRIVDLHGQQVVDLMAWTHPDTHGSQIRHSSMSYTRYRLQGSAPPQVGECIYTNLDEPMLKLVADTVKTHDLLYMACNPSFYARMGLEGHRNCAENISEAVTRAGLAGMKDGGVMAWNDVVDPFNLFQNTPYYSLKALGCSKPGDYVEFEGLMDCVVGLSCCPYEGEGFNGGKVTDVAVVTESEDKEGR